MEWITIKTTQISTNLWVRTATGQTNEKQGHFLEQFQAAVPEIHSHDSECSFVAGRK